MKCSNCGKENQKEDKFCSRCGESLEDNSSNLKMVEDRIVYFPEDNNEQSNNKKEVFNSKNQKSNKYIKIIGGVLVIFIVAFGLFKITGINISINNNKESTSESSKEKDETEEQNNNQLESETQKQINNTTENKTQNNDDINQNLNNDNVNNTKEDENQKNTIYNNENQIKNINIVNTESSSVLHDSFKNDYNAYQVLDGKKTTTWSEGVDGYGEGEFIRLYFDSDYTIKQLKIVNGLVNEYNAYYKNNRVKTLTISFSDGSSQVAYFEDNNTGYQTVEINGDVKSSYIELSLDSVYYGSKYDDTCISEVQVLGY